MKDKNQDTTYLPPVIEVFEIKSEKGFAQSIPGPRFNNEDWGVL